MVEAHIDVFLATDSQGQFTQQQVTAIGMNLIECTAELKAVEHLRINALTKQQIKGFVGKKLWG